VDSGDSEDPELDLSSDIELGWDWGGYALVPEGATLTDAMMCDGYSGNYYLPATLAQCRDVCDSWSGCAGFSWGLPSDSSPLPPFYLNRRRTLLAHDEPAVDGAIGSCYLMTSPPISSIASDAFTYAGCFAKGTRLPTPPAKRQRV
jgi:hypothetical protein